MSTDRIYRRR
ncbi:Protein of unknown function [Lactobacillus delbrueckii subsp. bulgaricus]|nr:Protein of unknown function [Lactobacillus delbrueckii subsp. bulgaricus]CDR74243.1 Protein of unknown function [Lactobacillus delbrueckii subsp. bulgaricus]